jgi:hypothetical protein
MLMDCCGGVSIGQERVLMSGLVAARFYSKKIPDLD